MTTPIKDQAQGFRIGLMLQPEENVAMPVVVDFTNESVFTKDFQQEQANLRIPFIQTVYIDNSVDANPLTLAFDGLPGQSITVKGRTQGYYPVVQQEGIPRITITSTQGAVKKQLIFLSVIVPPMQWATA